MFISSLRMEYEFYTSINDEKFKPYLRLRKSELSISLGEEYFVAESSRVFEHLLNSSLEIHSVLITPKWLAKTNLELLEKKVPHDKVYLTTEKNMESIVGFNLHQGVMAIAKRPISTSIEELDSRIIVLNGIVNPENVGSIVRTGVSFGFNSYLADQFSSHPFHRRAVRVSMGNVFQTKTLQVDNLLENLHKLKDMGYAVYGADSRVASQNIEKFQFAEKYALIIGSEFKGMSPEIIECCDAIIQINTDYPINASHAASIFMYQASL